MCHRMPAKYYIPRLIIVTGILLVLFSLFSDSIGIGKKGIQAAQISLFDAGIAVVLSGMALIICSQKSDARACLFSWISLRNKIQEMPAIFWVAIGLLPAFLPFLVAPMFFDASLRIIYLEGYIPKLIPIGNDLNLALTSVKTWLITWRTTQFIFTPVAVLLYSPLLLISYPHAYQAIVLATLVSYLVISFIAIGISEAKSHAVITLISTVSIFSYGLQFELERGQSHTITLMLCIVSIYIFHKYPHFRFFAYFFFSISVQLKFYPMLFIVLFIDNWQNWKENLMRFSAIGLANFMLLFLLGLRYFSSFLDHILNSVHDGESNAANHSIQSFIWFLKMSGMGIFNEQRQWIAGHSGLIEAALYIFFGVCFLSVLVNSYIKNSHGFNFDLLLLCTIGGMTLPSVNHDYTLPLLALPFALSLSTWHYRNYIWSTTITILMIVVSSFAYSLTLFPIEHKPLYLQNSLPMIFLIMAIVTIQNLAQKGRA